MRRRRFPIRSARVKQFETASMGVYCLSSLRPVSAAAPQPRQLGHRQLRQTLKSRIVEIVIRPLQQLLRGRATEGLQRLRGLRITRHTALPKWNYTIVPSDGR